MRVVALISGGKDSCYNMMQCEAHGHDIVALANLKPPKQDEMDSFMYQTVGHHAIDLYADAMSLPLFQRTIHGSCKETGEIYNENQEDEVEDLYQLLAEIKGKMAFDAVSVGAILSNYQRVRVEHVCTRLGLTPLAYLWRRDQTELLGEMINAKVEAIVIKVAALGLKPSVHLGMSIRNLYPHMLALKEKFGLNVCGEGGEYETFTLDCPLFRKKLIVDKMEQIVHSDDAFAQVCYLNFQKFHLENKKVELNMNMCCGVDFMKNDTETLDDLNKQFRTYSIKDNAENSSSTCLQKDTNKIPTTEHIHVKQNSSGFVWISGVTGQYTNKQPLQTVVKNTLDKLQDTLSNLGLLLESHATLIHLYVKNMADFTEINSVYVKYFNSNPPARVCVEACLPEDVLLQIDCLSCKNKKETMHVQSLSHWAPANIGPYSQTVKVGSIVFVSGCIGLVPCSATLVEGGIIEEAVLSLRHVHNILAVVMARDASLANVLLGFCYVSSNEFLPIVKEAWKRFSESLGKDDITVHSGMMIFVVIPSLPMNAAVEWHVIAHESKKSRKCIKQEVSAEVGVTMTSDACWSHEDGICALQYSIDYNGDNTHQLVEYLVKQIRQRLVSCGFSWDNLLIIRGFYQGITLEEDICQVFEDVLKEMDLAVPSMVFLPVIQLQNNVNLAVSCFIKTLEHVNEDL